MSFSTTYPALELKGLINVNSHTSTGIPNTRKRGAKNLHKYPLKPLFLNNSTATNIAIIYGNKLAIKGSEPFAPLTKPEYASTPFIKA